MSLIVFGFPMPRNVLQLSVLRDSVWQSSLSDFGAVAESLTHGDEFRAPPYRQLFCVLVRAG